jgi:MFS superfamily sulfate permease-like transporter
MPNYEAGAKTPLACVFAAILLVALVSVSAAVLEQIPLAAIGHAARRVEPFRCRKTAADFV